MKHASAKAPLHARSTFAQLELTCTVSTLTAVRAAVDNGADSIHLAFRPLQVAAQTRYAEFSSLKKAIEYMHAKRRIAVLDVLFPVPPEAWNNICGLISHAESYGIDAISFSDPAIMLYCMSNHPNLALYYAVPQERLNRVVIFDLHKRFGIRRVILPPECSLAMIEELRDQPHLEVEVQVYGGSSAITGLINCSEHVGRYPPSTPAMLKDVFHYLNGRFAAESNSRLTGRCATGASASNDSNYAVASSYDTHALELIPQLARIGVRAIHIEPALQDSANLARVTRVWHEAVNACYASPKQYAVKAMWVDQLNRCSKILHDR